MVILWNGYVRYTAATATAFETENICAYQAAPTHSTYCAHSRSNAELAESA